MKSMLHEASSVLKAVQKAWEASGKPEIFSIKVLEQGEKGFLWFSKRPAIVSITYEPKSVNQRGQAPRNTPRSTNSQDRRPTTQESTSGLRQTGTQQRTQTSRSYEGLRPTNSTQQSTRSTTLNKPEVRRTQFSAPLNENVVQHEQSAWTPELAGDVMVWLKEMVAIIGSSTEFVFKIDGKSLQITFAEPVLDNRESEKNLFMSFAYLLVQALKKKCKKKLRGFHLLITSRSLQSDADQAAS